MVYSDVSLIGIERRKGIDMPLITINHSFGTDGKGIAQTVAQKLGVELFDDKKLRTFVTKTEMSTSTEYRFDQQAPGFWERLRSREPQVYLDIMEAAVSQEEKDRIVEIVNNVHGITHVSADLSVWIYPL
jgi:hypothetical protein